LTQCLREKILTYFLKFAKLKLESFKKKKEVRMAKKKAAKKKTAKKTAKKKKK